MKRFSPLPVFFPQFPLFLRFFRDTTCFFLILLLISFLTVATAGEVDSQTPETETVLSRSTYMKATGLQIQLKREDRSIVKKLLRAEMISFNMQIAGYVMLVAMPKSITHWDYDHVAENYSNAWTKPPVLDQDGWYFNWLGHPLTGALHYNALRSQGVPAVQCFAYSTAQSFIWEYLVECMHERPSIQDLAITSTVGSLLGEGFHRATLGMRKNGFKWYEKIIVTIINPTYLINNGYK